MSRAVHRSVLLYHKTLFPGPGIFRRQRSVAHHIVDHIQGGHPEHRVLAEFALIAKEHAGDGFPQQMPPQTAFRLGGVDDRPLGFHAHGGEEHHIDMEPIQHIVGQLARHRHRVADEAATHTEGTDTGRPEVHCRHQAVGQHRHVHGRLQVVCHTGRRGGGIQEQNRPGPHQLGGPLGDACFLLRLHALAETKGHIGLFFRHAHGAAVAPDHQALVLQFAQIAVYRGKADKKSFAEAFYRHKPLFFQHIQYFLEPFFRTHGVITPVIEDDCFSFVAPNIDTNGHFYYNNSR